LSGSKDALHRCQPDSLDLTEEADFILAFWMAHEVPGSKAFFRQIAGLLRREGRFLLVEPKGHVGREDFERQIVAVQAAGPSTLASPKIAISRAALFQMDRL